MKFFKFEQYKKILKGMLFISSIVLSNSCVASYIEPSPGQPSAIIKGYKTGTGIHNYEIARMIQIDGRHNPTYYDYSKYISVAPGFHTFLIETTFVHGFLTTRYETKSTINAILKAGKRYQLMQAIYGKQIQVWIVDEKGRTVSSVANFTGRPARPSMAETASFLNIIK